MRCEVELLTRICAKIFNPILSVFNARALASVPPSLHQRLDTKCTMLNVGINNLKEDLIGEERLNLLLHPKY
jgi:hypothetical protein